MSKLKPPAIAVGATLLSLFGPSIQDAQAQIIALPEINVLAGTKQDSNGALVSGFDGDGKVLVDFGTVESESAREIAKDSNNRIIYAGTGCDVDALGLMSNCRGTIARVSAGGELDEDFDDDGKVILQVPGATQTGINAVVTSGNNIIVGGQAQISGHWQFFLAKYDGTDGSLDSNFGTNGVVVTDFSSTSDEYITELMLTGGKILAVGTADQQFALARYNSDGALDQQWDGSDGKVLIPFSSTNGAYAESVAITSQGRYIVAGWAMKSGYARIALASVKSSDATLDFDFDGDGKVLTTWSNQTSYDARDVVVDSNDRIVVAGGFGGKLGVARYLGATGALDSANFGTSGRTVIDVTAYSSETVNALSFMGTSIVLAGTAVVDADWNYRTIVTAKVNNSGAIVNSFGSSGNGIQVVDFASCASEGVGGALVTGSALVTSGWCM